MAQAQRFLSTLDKLGYDFFTGVPCSFLKAAFRLLEQEPADRYVAAVREDAALGFAAGAYLGGRQCAVFLQNSGLGVSINALLSLNFLYEIPCLLVISWRGYQGKDAPEHLQTSALMPGFLELMSIPWEVLDPDQMDQQLKSLTKRLTERRKPVALIVPPGILE